MRKFIFTAIITILLSPICFAGDNYVTYKDSTKLTKTVEREVRNVFKHHLQTINKYDIDGILSAYSNNYYNNDGFNKDIFKELITKTWKMYPDIKYTTEITHVEITGNTAIVYTTERAKATVTEKVNEIEITGYLKSISNNIYYLEKVGDKWLIISDNIISERTTLTYGEANSLKMELVVPQLTQAGKDYTASLNVKVPDSKMIVIASIGQEFITHPQVNSDEVYRKLPESGILERIFRANSNNFNEYTVASVGITRAKVSDKKQINFVVTGLGYIITRTNIIPEKDFSKVKQDGKKEKTAKSVD